MHLVGHDSHKHFFSTAPDGPPENVTVLATSPHSINVSWSEPAIITGPMSYLIDVTSVRQPCFTQWLYRCLGVFNTTATEIAGQT